MIDFLLGVPGKLKTIIDYLNTNLSTTRSAKIDNLDAAISTRATASALSTLSSTSLSNVTWTNARAALLDDIAVDVLAKPPTIVPIGSYKTILGQLGLPTPIGCITAATASATLLDVINVTGSGALELAFAATTAPGVYAARLVVTIDGVVVLDDTGTGTAGTYGATVAAGAVQEVPYWNGSAVGYSLHISALSSWPFKTSLRVQVAGGGAIQARAIVKYVRAT